MKQEESKNKHDIANKNINIVRMDENTKSEFEALCNYFGMNMNKAINVFAKAVIREKRIPFDISAPDYFSPENAKSVISAIRQEAAINGTNDMSMEEIDKEIDASRKERRR